MIGVGKDSEVLHMRGKGDFRTNVGGQEKHDGFPGLQKGGCGRVECGDETIKTRGRERVGEGQRTNPLNDVPMVFCRSV